MPGNIAHVLRTAVCILCALLWLPEHGPALADEPDAATKAILGEWVKDGTDVITIKSDGTFLREGGLAGSWKWIDKAGKRFEISHGTVASYTLTLSADGMRATGVIDRGEADKIGKHIEFVRKNATTAAAGNPAAANPVAAPGARIVIEALIDGPSELRVTKSGVYWINLGNAKPGRHDGRNEPTYVDDQPWKPEWKNPGKDRGADTSDLHPLQLDPDHLQFELLAVGDKHGSTGIQKRSPITVKKAGDELSIVIPDPEGGSRWYRFALAKYTGPEPFPLVLGSGAKAGSPVNSPPPSVDTAKTSAPQMDAGDILKTNRHNLVFVQGPDGAGSGFIANLNGATYLVTNAHVAAGARGAVFKTLNDAPVKIGAPSAAVGHDIFRIVAESTGRPLEIMDHVNQNAAIGDDVVVLGNAEGAGVINTIKGRIVGLGPNLVEVNAPFQPGNSGSPIIHLKSGKVVGVATYLTVRKYDSATKEPVKEPVVRRFGYRLDSATIWQPVKWDLFFAQSTEMETIEKLTQDLVGFLKDLSKNGTVTRGAHTNPVIKNRIDAWLEARAKRLSPRDTALADQSLLSFLKLASQSDVTAARQHFTYDYFQRGLAEQEKERSSIAEVFEKIMKSL